ncbi:MAG: ribonuclease H-like domain-containing protein [Candidatus Bathyarchaeota archaeon]|nr:ribonuclease H-like domain-containing protein [Candidatus Bathyarchaeota archaeon]
MPVVYACKNCGTRHSKSHYAKSRLCKKCGRLLLSQFITARFNTENSTGNNFSGKKPFQNRFSSISAEYFSLQKAAKNLFYKTRNQKAYSLFSQNELEKKPETKENQWWLLHIEHKNAQKLKKQLMKKYKKKSLEQTIPGKTISNTHGDFYSINEISKSEFNKMDYRKCKKNLLSDLKILSGIGPKREFKLKKDGYSSIKALENHPLWKKSASNFMNLINKKEIGQLQSHLWKNHPKSHPLIHYLAGLNKTENFAIVDIETLGLSERPIVLIGIATLRKKAVHTSQLLMRSISDEPAAIWAFTKKIHSHYSLISYNGRSFDIPYIQQRLAYYGIDCQINNPHFDLLHFTRRALRHKLRNCRLETVEEYLNIGRGINIPGALVPEFYQTYQQTGNVGPLVAIVEHNKQDLITLATLFSRLYEEWNS